MCCNTAPTDQEWRSWCHLKTALHTEYLMSTPISLPNDGTCKPAPRPGSSRCQRHTAHHARQNALPCVPVSFCFGRNGKNHLKQWGLQSGHLNFWWPSAFRPPITARKVISVYVFFCFFFNLTDMFLKKTH